MQSEFIQRSLQYQCTVFYRLQIQNKIIEPIVMSLISAGVVLIVLPYCQPLIVAPSYMLAHSSKLVQAWATASSASAGESPRFLFSSNPFQAWATASSVSAGAENRLLFPSKLFQACATASSASGRPLAGFAGAIASSEMIHVLDIYGRFEGTYQLKHPGPWRKGIKGIRRLWGAC